MLFYYRHGTVSAVTFRRAASYIDIGRQTLRVIKRKDGKHGAKHSGLSDSHGGRAGAEGAAAAIQGETVKVDSSRTRRGCSWGVAFPAVQLRNVMTVFANAGIKTREILR